jgi:hypothetical protein
MKLFIIVNNVDGLTNGVYVELTLKAAIKAAVGLAAKQCDSKPEDTVF